MRISLFALLTICCISCSGCATVGGAIIEGLFDSAATAIFGNDCEVDPQILKRKGIKPGSKEHRRLEADMSLQKSWENREQALERKQRNEDLRRMKELEAYRKINAGIETTLESERPPLLPPPLTELN